MHKVQQSNNRTRKQKKRSENTLKTREEVTEGQRTGKNLPQTQKVPLNRHMCASKVCDHVLLLAFARSNTLLCALRGSCTRIFKVLNMHFSIKTHKKCINISITCYKTPPLTTLSQKSHFIIHKKERQSKNDTSTSYLQLLHHDIIGIMFEI